MSGKHRAIRLVPADAGHVVPLAARLRPIDRIECAAMGRTPEQALYHGIRVSAQCWTALIGEAPHAMFGVVVASVASSDAVPWFVGSAKVARHGRALIAQGPVLIDQMHCHGRALRNFVAVENRPAIRLLKRWGFTIDPDPIVVRGVEFRRFMREFQ